MTGLVLEGGANRTYYSVGVLDAFLDNNIEVDFVVGVSAGIANGISYVSHQKGRSLEIGLKYITDKRYMGFKYYFKKDNRSYYNIDFVFNKIPDEILPFDFETFNSYKGKVYAVVTNLETAKPEYIEIDDYNSTGKAILASCALPFMFKAIDINGKKYYDGGCSDPLPVKFAFDSGCNKIITILTRERSYKKQSDKESVLSSVFFRKNKDFAKVLKTRGEVYNNSRDYLFKKEEEGSTFVFAPKSTHGWKRTEKNLERIKSMYDEGYADCINRLDELKEFLK